MAGDRKVRYTAEIDTSDVAAQAQRANAILQREQQKSVQQQVRTETQIARLATERARAEAASATARARAGQEYARSEATLQRAIAEETRARQSQVRLVAEAARADAAATAAKQRQLSEALRIQQQSVRLASDQARQETQAAQAKVRAEQDALRLRQQQANVAAAEARQARAQSAPTGGGMSGLAGLGGMAAGALATVGIGLGVREIVQTGTAMASLNIQLTRSRQAFEALSGSGEEAERRLAAIQRASANTMTSLESMNLANRMTALGMANSAGEMETAVAAARKIAVVMGTDTIGAIENLALAASNLSFMRLDQMGISATQVRERMAQLRSENSELGKEQAFLQAALQVSSETLKDVDVSGRDAASGVEALAAAWGRLTESVAQGAVGQGANSFLLGLSQIIDRDLGNATSQAQAWRREFDEALAGERSANQRRENGEWFVASGGGDLGQGAQLEGAFGQIDAATAAGVRGLEQYEAALASMAERWVAWHHLSDEQIASLSQITTVLDRLTNTSGAYMQAQQRLTEEGRTQDEQAQSLLDQYRQLEAAYAEGKISGDGYEATLGALGTAMDALPDKIAEVTALTADMRKEIAEAARAADLFVRSAGTMGAAAGVLTQAQADLFATNRRYLDSGGVIDPKTGSPQVDPKSGARVLQPGAWGYVPGFNDGSEQWEWDSEQRKQAAADRERIAREEEQAQKSWKSAAESTQREMESAAKKLQADFESALGKVPGLLGTSSVTDEDKQMADAGVYQEKADEWLRQLADEVLNGVDRPNVDINDAKRRAGLPAGMDDKAALAMVQSMWGDSSLFAGGANIDLINQAAVQANLARQNASASGRNAVLSSFGLPTEAIPNFAGNAAAAGAAASGSALDQAVISGDIMAMVAALQSQTNTEEVVKGLSDVGVSLARGIHGGFVGEVNALDWRSPIVDAISAEVTALVTGNLTSALSQ